jgi:hypothetical protein
MFALIVRSSDTLQEQFRDGTGPQISHTKLCHGDFAIPFHNCSPCRSCRPLPLQQG